MSEELPTTPEQPTEDTPQAPPLDLDPEIMKKLEEKLAAFQQSGEATASGSEAPQIDLDQYEIDPDLEHLYRRAKIERSPEGEEVWVALHHEYMILSGNTSAGPGSLDKKGIPTRMDEKIMAVVNGPQGLMTIPQHGWRLSALLPNGICSLVAVFERLTRRALPIPPRAKKEADLPVVTDEELARMQEKAAEWENKEKTDATE